MAEQPSSSSNTELALTPQNAWCMTSNYVKFKETRAESGKKRVREFVTCHPCAEQVKSSRADWKNGLESEDCHEHAVYPSKKLNSLQQKLCMYCGKQLSNFRRPMLAPSEGPLLCDHLHHYYS